MSTPSSRKSNEPPAQLYRKPRADVFTMLLVIALLAIIIATVALWWLMQDYEYKIKGGPVAMHAPPAAPSGPLSLRERVRVRARATQDIGKQGVFSQTALIPCPSPILRQAASGRGEFWDRHLAVQEPHEHGCSHNC